MTAPLANSFSRAAPGYDRHALVQTAMAGWLAEWLPTERTGRVLEVGAGTGLFTRHLSGWPGGVTATDLSPVMTRAGRAAVPSVSWRLMEAGHPLPGPWDWIVSSAMLQWAGNPAEVFSAWRKVLAPNGRIVAGLFLAGSLLEWRTLAGEDAPLTWRTAAEWRAGLVRAGLRIARDETVTKVFKYPSALNFLRSLHGVGAAPERRYTSVVLRRKLSEYGAKFGAGENGEVQASWVFHRFEADLAALPSGVFPASIRGENSGNSLSSARAPWSPC